MENNPDYKAHRWVVEVTHSWMNRFRKLLVRFEKTDISYLGLINLVCAFIAFRKIQVIYGSENSQIADSGYYLSTIKDGWIYYFIVSGEATINHKIRIDGTDDTILPVL